MDQENPLIIPKWPYGRKIRCYKRFWIETATSGTKKGQQRVCEQTTIKGFNSSYTNSLQEGDPLPAPTDDYMWNKPKYSTYHLLAMVSQNEEGKIVYDYLDVYSDANKIANFANKHRDNLSETQLKTISMLQDS